MEKIAPLQSSIEFVAAQLNKEGVTFSVSPNVGFSKQEEGQPAKTVGRAHIRAKLCETKKLFHSRSLSAFFGFDSRGKLIEIWLWEVVEGL